ncbi:DUF397 domain-containing protein [Streptomyces sp. MBT53]|nr:DUF397 domain-containing protein [Streptomyces sp. MBT53]
MYAGDIPGAVWRKASYSNGGESCVEVADVRTSIPGTIAVRDSKDPDGPALTFPVAAFTAFVDGTAADDFSAR